MTKQHENFYRLQDGTQADPSDVSKGKDGVLRHKNGLAVLLDDKGEPQTIGQAAADNKNVEAASAGEDKKPDAEVEDKNAADDKPPPTMRPAPEVRRPEPPKTA